MWSQFTNVTDRQTDGQTTCDRKTALCTKAHCAIMKQHKTQQNKTTLVQSPLTILDQEMRWAYSTTLQSPLRTNVIKVITQIKQNKIQSSANTHLCISCNSSAAACGLPSRRWNLALARINSGRLADCGCMQQPTLPHISGIILSAN